MIKRDYYIPLYFIYIKNGFFLRKTLSFPLTSFGKEGSLYCSYAGFRRKTKAENWLQNRRTTF